MPKKSKPAKRRPEGVTRDKWQVTGKTKPLYRRPAPKPAAKVHSPQSTVKSQKPDARSSTGDRGHKTSDFSHPHLLAPSHFELREDGSIGAPASGTARSKQTPNAVLEAGAPPLGAAKRSEDGTTLNAQPSTMPPRLAFTDPVRGIWLYHGNSLELLDAIAAKYPDGRFDAIFADPPALP